MASVEKDATRKQTPWIVRWRDEAGKQRKRGFGRKLDADRFRAEVEHQLNSGTYVDHAAGATTFNAFFIAWATRQVWAPNTDRAEPCVWRLARYLSRPFHCASFGAHTSSPG
jgi:hypothetical protein